MNNNNAKSVANLSVSYTTAALLFVSLNTAALEPHHDLNLIAPNSLNNITGIIGVNTAAGDNNIQTNNKSIAIGRNPQAISKSQLSTQALNNNGIASVRIEANTLQNAQGLIGINQVAGSSNVQLNDLTIALGENSQIISDVSLSVRPATEANSVGGENNNNKSFYLDKNSLKGATGTIQINQIAGNGNIAVNRVSMPIQ